MLASCHDCLFLWIPDDRHSVAWPCLSRSWFPEGLVGVLIVLDLVQSTVQFSDGFYGLSRQLTL